MYEVIHTISLVVLWICIALNVWTIIRGVRLNKKLKADYDTIERLIREWEEDHNLPIVDEEQ